MDMQHKLSTDNRGDGAAPHPHAPGVVAIADALLGLYGQRRPIHFDNPHPASLGGPDPLDGVSVFRRAEPTPHWHYVTYGFSDLFAKASPNPAVSGFGFELTCRVAAGRFDEAPPMWPIFLLQSLGRYVFKTRNGFHEGHRMSIDGPISLGTPTELNALAFAFDPELPPIDTPFGHVAFLQVVGLTRDEEAAAQHWDTRKLLGALLPHLPLWITHLERGSLLDQPDVRTALDAGIAQDGSSSVAIFTDVLDIGARKRFLRQPALTIALGARQIEQLIALLPLRLPFKRPLTITGPRTKVQFDLARRNRFTWHDGVLHLDVNEQGVRELSTLLHPRQGVYRLPSFQAILWDVQQTWIRNAEGELVGVIG